MEEPNAFDINFDWSQIFFALQPQRLLFIDAPACWLEFHSVNPANMVYIDYSPEQLCERFLNRVLVHINNFELNEREKHLVCLLELHPNFRRTEDGFIKSVEHEKIDFSRNANLPIRKEPLQNTPEEGFIMESSDLNCQVIVTPYSGEPRSKPQLSEESAALLSVVLSSDNDLGKFERISEEEMLKRLRKAKTMFEQKGYQMENLDIPLDDLLVKLKRLRELKEAIVCLIKEKF